MEEFAKIVHASHIATIPNAIFHGYFRNVPRIILTNDPFVEHRRNDEFWEASWISRPDSQQVHALVTLYRLRLHLPQPRTLRLHLSGDEWFEFFCDGQLVLRGPAIGSPRRWFYETLSLDLSARTHELVARVFSLGTQLRPQPVMSVEPSFLCSTDPDDPLLHHVATGLADWEWRDVSKGWHFTVSGICDQQKTAFGPVLQELPYAGLCTVFEDDSSSGWSREVKKRPARIAACSWAEGRLEPDLSPVVERSNVAPPNVRSVDQGSWHEPYEVERNGEASRWTSEKTLLIPAGERRRMLLDFDDYVVGFARLRLSAGANARLFMTWTERLMRCTESPDCWNNEVSRNEIAGLLVVGPRDEWRTEEAGYWSVGLPWKRCGRYLEIVVEAGEEEDAEIGAFTMESSLPPSPWNACFSSDHALLEAILPKCKRCLEVGMGSTFCDTPYYEQVQWVGDLYPILLCHFAAGGDDPMYRQALMLVADSVEGTGLTQARYPHARSSCVILSFALWYVVALHDYALWRGHPEFIRKLMPTARRNLETFLALRNSNGLCVTPPGWNYFDWASEWNRGMPPQNGEGECGPLNLLVALACQKLSALDCWLGEAELADRWLRYSSEIFAACREQLWDEQRLLFRDAPGNDSFSEHVQTLALLHEDLFVEERGHLTEALARKPSPAFQDGGHGLTPVRPFFSHHLFEAMVASGRVDLLFQRLEAWRAIVELDLKTTPETMPGTRSDSHGWSAHPLYHALASVAGIRPAVFGFSRAIIRPQPGPLEHYEATVWSPKGPITTQGRVDNGQWVFSGELPDQLPATLVLPDGTAHEVTGRYSITMNIPSPTLVP